MLANSVFAIVLATVALASASPVQFHGQGSACKPGESVPVLPVNGGGSELPAPPRDLILKHIALGFGIQNYSCTGTDAVPAATGALAVLYDVTHLYPGQDHSSLTAEQWTALPSAILKTGKVPLNRNGNGGASLTSPFPQKGPLRVKGLHKPLPYLGHHFFNAANVPTFDLDAANQILNAKKIVGIKAPVSAPAGHEGTGSVDWLYLGDAGGSHGVSSVYRVLTAGGTSHGCKAKGTDSTPYTALYWFYGVQVPTSQ